MWVCKFPSKFSWIRIFFKNQLIRRGPQICYSQQLSAGRDPVRCRRGRGEIWVLCLMELISSASGHRWAKLWAPMFFRCTDDLTCDQAEWFFLLIIVAGQEGRKFTEMSFSETRTVNKLHSFFYLNHLLILFSVSKYRSS